MDFKCHLLTPPGHLVSPLACRGPWMSTVVLYCLCHSDGASVLLYFTFQSLLLFKFCIVNFLCLGSDVPRLSCYGIYISQIVSLIGDCTSNLKCQSLRLLPGTWSHLWFAGVRECPPWCSIVGASVTAHQFFCILHLNLEKVILLLRTTTPWGRRGFKSWIRPPYPQRVVKGDLIGRCVGITV